MAVIKTTVSLQPGDIAELDWRSGGGSRSAEIGKVLNRYTAVISCAAQHVRVRIRFTASELGMLFDILSRTSELPSIGNAAQIWGANGERPSARFSKAIAQAAFSYSHASGEPMPVELWRAVAAVIKRVDRATLDFAEYLALVEGAEHYRTIESAADRSAYLRKVWEAKAE